MDASLQAVLLFHNHQAISPNIAFSGTAAAAAAVPAREEPPPAEPAPEPVEEGEKPNG